MHPEDWQKGTNGPEHPVTGTEHFTNGYLDQDARSRMMSYEWIHNDTEERVVVWWHLTPRVGADKIEYEKQWLDPGKHTEPVMFYSPSLVHQVCVEYQVLNADSKEDRDWKPSCKEMTSPFSGQHFVHKVSEISGQRDGNRITCYEAIHNDTNEPVMVWWQLHRDVQNHLLSNGKTASLEWPVRKGKWYNSFHYYMHPDGTTTPQEFSLSLVHQVCVRHGNSDVSPYPSFWPLACKVRRSPSKAGEYFIHQVSDIISQSPSLTAGEVSRFSVREPLDDRVDYLCPGLFALTSFMFALRGLRRLGSFHMSLQGMILHSSV